MNPPEMGSLDFAFEMPFCNVLARAICIPQVRGKAAAKWFRSEVVPVDSFKVKRPFPVRSRACGGLYNLQEFLEGLALVKSSCMEKSASATVNIQAIVSMPFQENSYVVWKTGRTDCLVFDPGFEPELILDFVRQEKLTPAALLLTHGHADHIAGNAALKKVFPEAPILIGEKDEEMLGNPWANLSAPFGMEVTSPPADRLLREGDRVAFAGIEMDVLDIPGHSPGHIVYVFRDEPIQVFGGDVLFQGSIGRTDFPGGDGQLLCSGIREKLFTLSDDTVVYPGHGPETTVGREKRTNPFVGE